MLPLPLSLSVILENFGKWRACTNFTFFYEQVHHTFTLVELLAMAGFHLALNTIKSGFSAAEASVSMLESILGSTESSRALSSIITLVRSELAEEPGSGPVVSLTSLTKALTAFVCVQTATHRRTLKEMRLRVVYDCTVLLEDTESNTAIAPNFIYDGKYGRKSADEPSELLTDVRSELRQNLKATRSSGPTIFGEEDEVAVIEEKLESLCGDCEEERGEEKAGQDRLPEEVMNALREVQAGRDRKGKRKSGYTIEVEEVTTKRTTKIQTTRPNSTSTSPTSRSRAASVGFNSSLSSMGSHDDHGGDDHYDDELNEDDWVEVNRMLAEGRDAEEAGDPLGIPLPLSGNPSVAALTRQETLQNREGSRARLQVSCPVLYFSLFRFGSSTF